MPLSRRGPRSRRPVSTAGGLPLPLPIAATVGASNVTATSAILVGSINLQGLAGSWWFVYGTSPQYGQATPVQDPSGIIQTVTAAVTGLTTGDEYWFAMVASTAAGTVTATPLTFTPASPPAVTNASLPLVMTSTPAVSVPHFQFPFVINGNSAAVVEQDSYEEILSTVQVIVACEIGTCPELPTFGRPDLTFSQAPIDTSALLAAVQQWEPRATYEAVVSALDTVGASWGVALTAQMVNTSGQ